MTITPATVVAASPGWLDFYRAQDWGRNPKHEMAPERLNDPEGFLHHTAGSLHSTDPIRAMQVQEQSAHARGYATVSYDAMIHRNTDTGQVSILGGREGYRSAATKDRNEQGEALCIMGYFHPGSRLSESPTEREIEAAAWGFVWLMSHGWLAWDAKIMGHRDNPAHVGSTVCPGDYLYRHLPAIRDRVNSIIGLLSNTIPPPSEGNRYVTPIDPVRIIDTREFGDKTPLEGGRQHTFGLELAVPNEAVGAFITITATRAEDPGYISVSQVGSPTLGDTSCLNYNGGPQAVANTTLVPLAERKFWIVASTPVHVIVDCVGYIT